MAVTRAPLVSLLAMAAASTTGTAAQAQATPPVTSIIPDTAADRSVGTTVSTSGAVTTIDGGHVAGTNLFHSFSNFDLGQGETAQWIQSTGDPASITNVINRVTGGTPSSIFGTLDSTALLNADFYFINPAGIIFGEGAQIDVPAASYFSTASELRFANGDKFTVATPNGSTLSVAAPQAFGFIGNEGDIVFQDGANLDSVGKIDLSASNVRMSNAFLRAAGGISITAGDLTLSSSQIRSDVVDAPGGDVEIHLHGGLSASNSSIGTTTSGAASGGSVVVRADNVSLAGSFVYTNTSGGTGSGGNIDITTAGLLLMDGTVVGHPAVIQAVTSGAGHGGDVTIHSGDLELRADALIAAATLPNSSGDSGNVTIDVMGKLKTVAYRDGENIYGGRFQSTTEGSGRGGNLNVTAGTIDVVFALFNVWTASGAPGGNLSVTATDKFTAWFSTFDARTSSSGRAGNIKLRSLGDLILNNSAVRTSTTGDGAAGDVTVQADHDIIGIGAFFSSDSSTKGDAGDVFLKAQTIQLTDRSGIRSDAFKVAETQAAGGDITLDARTIILDLMSITTDTYDGSAGSIHLNATDRITMTDTALLASSYGTGAAGEIILRSGREISGQRTQLISGAFGTGTAGSISVIGPEIALTDSFLNSEVRSADRAAGSILLNGGEINLIRVDATTRGRDGNIAVFASRDINLDETELDAVSFGPGDAGRITVAGPTVNISDGSDISSSNIANGPAGNVALIADNIYVSGSGISTDTLGAGAAGGILFIGKQIVLDDQTTVSSEAKGLNGTTGLIVVDGGSVTLDHESTISTTSHNSNQAGSISVDADTINLANGSVVRSSNVGDGDAGNIAISSAGDVTLTEAAIETNARSGAAGDITITMSPASILLLEGLDEPARIETSVQVGAGSGGVITISNPLAIILNGGSILALGASGGANVQIDTPFFISSTDRKNSVEVDGTLTFTGAITDVSSGTVEQDLTVLDASAVLRGQCTAVRSSGTVSQLDIRPVGPFGSDSLINAAAPQRATGASAGCH